MSLKSFDDFCARMINNDPVSEKEVYDERQNMIRTQLTKRALWLFVITSGINLIIMECGPQWCESWVLSTAFFGAVAHLYWTAANIKHGSLFGLHGTTPIVSQIGFLFGEGLFIPILILTDDSNTDVAANFFIRNGMVSEYFMWVLDSALLLAAGIVMAVSVRNYKKKEKESSDTDKV